MLSAALAKSFPVQSFSMSNSAMLAADHAIRLIRMFFTKDVFKGYSDRISSIAFSPDDRFAVSGGFAHQFFLDQSARIWEIPSGRKVRELKGHKCGVFSVAYSPDGRVIATGGGGIVRGTSWRYDNAIRTWDAQTGRQISRFGEDLFFVDTLAFSPDGRFLASGSKNHAPRAPHKDGGCLRLWDWRSGTETCSFGSHVSAVTSVSFSPDGKYLASGSNGMRADGSMPGGRQVKMRMVNANPDGEALPAEAGMKSVEPGGSAPWLRNSKAILPPDALRARLVPGQPRRDC